jgi:hypothetical protein
VICHISITIIKIKLLSVKSQKYSMSNCLLFKKICNYTLIKDSANNRKRATRAARVLVALTSALSRCARPQRGKVSREASARSAIGHWLVQEEMISNFRNDICLKTQKIQKSNQLFS